MAGYRARLEADLDRWIADGLVPAESRAAILDRASTGRRLDAGAALAVIGALLAGVAVVAFIAANWGAIPRLGRFAMIQTAFLGVVAAAAWTGWRGQLMARNTLLAVAALVYAAAIGLTGQIFDVVGDPQAALRGAGVAAAVLALAGRSSGAAALSLLFVALGDKAGDASLGPPVLREWLAWFAAPAGALAIAWRSKPLAHAAALALIVAAFTLKAERSEAVFLAASVGFALLAAVARWFARNDDTAAPVFYGWFVVGAVGYFALAGIDPGFIRGVIHRVAWLAVGAGAVALGRSDRHAVITAAGVLSLLGAICTILFDLGLSLMAAAGVFGVAAVVALGAGLALRLRGRA